MQKFTTMAAALALFAVPASATVCDPGLERWTIEDRGLRFETYRPGETVSYGPILFEAFDGEELLWRVEGEYGCSNGISFCSVSIPMSDGEPITTSETVFYEGEVPQYVVFADLYQLVAHRQMMSADPVSAEAEVFRADAAKDADGRSTIRLPSYYRFAGSREVGEAYD